MYLSGAFKTTSGKRALGAFTLVELMVATAVGLVACAAILSFSFFTSRSVAAMSNYAALNEQSQLALDKLTQQIRQVNQLTNYATVNGAITSLTFQDYDNDSLTFAYDPTNCILTRTKAGQSQTLLKDCTALNFTIYQRNVQAGTFDAVTTATTNCKLVEVSWVCSRPLMNQPNTESMQSTKITIRQ